MSRRRLNSIASLIDGFNAGYSTVGKVLRDRDMAKIAKAQPEEMAGPLEESAGPPEASGAMPEANRPVSFLGRAYNEPLTDEMKSRARMEAQAGVLDKHGDLEGASRVRDRIAAGELRTFQMGEAKKASERGDKLFQWQEEDRQRQQKARDDEETYKTGRRELFAGSFFGQRAAAFAKELQEYQRKQEAYDEAVRRGDAGAVAPTRPMPPAIGPAEMLADAGAMLFHDAKHGKATHKELIGYSDLMRKSMEEGQVQAMRLAQSGAPLTQVVAAFNAQGQQKIDPAGIVSDEMVDRGNGVKTRILKIKQEDGSIATVDTLASLDAFKAAGDYFQRAHQAFTERMALRADARAGAAEGRAQATFNAGAGQRQAEVALGEAQAAVIAAKTTEERAVAIDRLRLVREGLSAGAPAAEDKNAPAEVKLARAAIQAGMYRDMGEALRWATSSKAKSPAEIRASLYEKALQLHMGDAERAKAATDAGMGYLFPQGAAAPAAGGGGGGAPAAAAPANANDARAQAEEALRRGASKDAVNQRLQQLGFPPL